MKCYQAATLWALAGSMAEMNLEQLMLAAPSNLKQPALPRAAMDRACSFSFSPKVGHFACYTSARHSCSQSSFITLTKYLGGCALLMPSLKGAKEFWLSRQVHGDALAEGIAADQTRQGNLWMGLPGILESPGRSMVCTCFYASYWSYYPCDLC